MGYPRRAAAAIAPWREASATIPLHADGSVRIAVVADTHSQPHRATIEHLRAFGPDAILHAGDIGDLAVLDELAKVAPLHAVRGNIDTRAPDLPDSIALDLVGADGPVLRIFLMHIAVNGPRLRADALRRAKAAHARMVVCGHSHVPFIGEDRGLFVFNPGSVGPRRFSLPIVFGTIELGARGLALRHVDCETGRAWTPP